MKSLVLFLRPREQKKGRERERAPSPRKFYCKGDAMSLLLRELKRYGKLTKRTLVILLLLFVQFMILLSCNSWS